MKKWNLLGLFFLLCYTPVTFATHIIVHNNTGVAQTIYTKGYDSAGCVNGEYVYGSEYYNVGEVKTNNYVSWSKAYAGCEWSFPGTGKACGGATVDYMHIYCGGGAPAYKYCVYHIQYYNDTGKVVAPLFWLDDGQYTTFIGGSDPYSATAILPGSSVDYYLTNNIGTNLVCYDLTMGDSRSGAALAAFEGTGYSGGSGSDPPSGHGDDSIKQGSDPKVDPYGSNTNHIDPNAINPNTGKPYGTGTNGVVGGDIGNLGDRIIGALNALLKDVSTYPRQDTQIAQLGTTTNLLADIKNKIGGVDTNTAGAVTNLMGITGQGLTNVNDKLSMVNSNLNAAFFGYSNGIGIVHVLHEFYSAFTNAVQDTNSHIQGGLETSASGASNRAWGYTSAQLTKYDSLVGALSATPSVQNKGTAMTTLEMTAHLVPGQSQYDMVLNPIGGDWAEAWSVAKKIMSWFLVAVFIWRVIKDSDEAVLVAMSARGYNVPNTTFTVFGIGGNWAAVAYPLLLTAVMTLYGVLILVFLDFVTTSSFSQMLTLFMRGPTGESTFVSKGVSFGVWLLYEVTPLEMMIEVGISYLLFKATLSKATWVCVTAVKMLAGA